MRLHYRLGWLVMLALAKAAWGFRRHGAEWIPVEGPAIIACNHVSNWDPILVGLGSPRELHFMAKGELFGNRFLSAIVRTFNALPVRRGVLDRGALRAASAVLMNGELLLMFPSGTRNASGEVRNPKSGVGFLACMNEVPVVPACIKGANDLGRAFFRGSGVEVTFGRPLQASKAESSDEYRAFSRRVADEIGRLKQEVDGR